ncbi:hypothetical protein SBRCBS47491_007553 [Sporothrix bragantina]|uniref:EF-hand domain-containing protein n=1 Tax=Sporothrix bragantina TaxID=671064 RepID=A0ABP0CGY1_9PEZI
MLFLPYQAADDTASGLARLYCTQHRLPGNSLDPHISALKVPLPYEFIAHVRITARLHADFGVPELMKLATLPHLGILEIIEHAPVRSPFYDSLDTDGDDTLDANQVSDRLIKGWSLTHPGPFPALRVLRLWGCGQDMLTQACLQYATEFPQLAHFEVSVVESLSRPGAANTWSRAKRTAATLGWTGFSLGKQELQYRTCPDEADTSASPANITLSRVEAQSVPVDALQWGARIYYFLKETGYDASKTRQELLEAIVVGKDADKFSRGNFALMGLGSDRADTGRSRAWQPGRAFCFIRTPEALAELTAQKEHRATIGRTDENVCLHSAPQNTDARTLQPPPAKRRKGGRTIGSMLSDFTA